MADTKLPNGGRIIASGDAMAPFFLGSAEGGRLRIGRSPAQVRLTIRVERFCARKLLILQKARSGEPGRSRTSAVIRQPGKTSVMSAATSMTDGPLSSRRVKSLDTLGEALPSMRNRPIIRR
jgi:hypothetical protein